MILFILDDMQLRREALHSRRPLAQIRWSSTFDQAMEGAEWWHGSNGSDSVCEVWLDHDLSERHYHGDYSDAKTGLDFARRMIENGWFKTSTIYVHTMNPQRGELMVQELQAAGYSVKRELLEIQYDIRDDWRDSG